jgi:hypothetical protein
VFLPRGHTDSFSAPTTAPVAVAELPVTELKPDFAGQGANGEVASGCAVCPHPWPTHDRIAARFCTATVAGKFTRGCVCTPYPDKEIR